MKNLMTCCVAAALAMCFAAPAAQARPKYMGEFKKAYPDVEGLSEAKCNVCHEGKSKKNKNNFGKAYGMTLNAKNCKDVELIKKALKEVESKPSAISGKTFGDLLKDNKLPGSAE